MKVLNFVMIALLCVITMGLASCGDDNYYTIQNSDEKLCGKTWVEQYTNDEGNLCIHQLEFTKVKQNNKDILSGKETTVTYIVGGTNTATADFTWQWIDTSMEGLLLNYGNGDVEHFGNVWVREHYLSGKLGEKVIVLTDLASLIKK